MFERHRFILLFSIGFFGRIALLCLFEMQDNILTNGRRILLTATSKNTGLTTAQLRFVGQAQKMVSTLDRTSSDSIAFEFDLRYDDEVIVYIINRKVSDVFTTSHIIQPQSSQNKTTMVQAIKERILNFEHNLKTQVYAPNPSKKVVIYFTKKVFSAQ